MRTAVVVILALALAGCASPGPQPAVTAANASPGGPGLGDTVTLARAANGNGAEWSWTLDGPAEAIALEVEVDVGANNDCKFTRAVANHPSGSAPYRLSILEQASGTSWSLGAGPAGEGLHAGALDTRAAEEGGLVATQERTMGAFSGLIRLTLLATDLEPWDAGFLPVGASAAVSISCTSAFEVESAQLGSSVLLAGAPSLAGGLGLDAGHATLNVGDVARGDVEGASVKASCSGFGGHGALVALQHPSGQASWVMAPDAAVGPTPPLDVRPTAAGTHEFTVHRTAAYLESFWCAAWGLDGAAA